MYKTRNDYSDNITIQLSKKHIDVTCIPEPDKSHQETAKAYLDWWNSNTEFEVIKNNNPLEATDYVWR